MSLQKNIIEKLQLNPAHTAHCQTCFDTTASTKFWVWDPAEAPDPPYAPVETPANKFAQLLLNPTGRQRKESLEVRCEKEREWTLAAIDKCLVAGASACDGLIFEAIPSPKQVVWLELKMNMKRRNPNPKTLEDRIIGEAGTDKSAIEQILSAKRFFEEKAVPVAEYRNKGHVAIPKELTGLAKKSQAINARIMKIRKQEGIVISTGPVLELS